MVMSITYENVYANSTHASPVVTGNWLCDRAANDDGIQTAKQKRVENGGTPFLNRLFLHALHCTRPTDHRMGEMK